MDIGRYKKGKYDKLNAENGFLEKPMENKRKTCVFGSRVPAEVIGCHKYPKKKKNKYLPE
jgi:hypothetical protein